MLKKTKYGLEYTQYSFTTDKGTFRLSGSSSDGIDEFRELGTANFHKWKRTQLYEWLIQGKINPVDESKDSVWYKGMEDEEKVPNKGLNKVGKLF